MDGCRFRRDRPVDAGAQLVRGQGIRKSTNPGTGGIGGSGPPKRILVPGAKEGRDEHGRCRVPGWFEERILLVVKPHFLGRGPSNQRFGCCSELPGQDDVAGSLNTERFEIELTLVSTHPACRSVEPAQGKLVASEAQATRGLARQMHNCTSRNSLRARIAMLTAARWAFLGC